MYREAAFELQKTLAIADDGFLYRDIFRLAPVRKPLITRLGSNYTILETTQVVEKNGGRGGIEPPTRGFSVSCRISLQLHNLDVAGFS